MKTKITDKIYMKFQCDVIRAVDSSLKERSIRKSNRRKLVEGILFSVSEVFEKHDIQVGSKRIQFPFHEYAFGNVDWYYDAGFSEYDKEEKDEENDKKNKPSIEKVGRGFPKCGYDRYTNDCYKWATKDGYVLGGWFGGSLDNDRIVNVWGKYFAYKKIFCRIKFKDKIMDWKELKKVSGEKEKRMLRYAINDKSYAVDLKVDDVIYTGLCTKDWEMA